MKDKYTLTATITTSGRTTGSATCAYKINYTSSGHLRWDIAPDMATPCKDEALLCSSCAIACKKSFNTNKDRYNTKFTITN